MDEGEIVAKVIKYLQGQPKGSKLTYGKVAREIDLPNEAGRIKRIIRRSDSPYFRPVLGGVKALGLGSKKIQAARNIARSQRRGFLRKIFETDPEATLRPGVSISSDGRIKLGQNDYLDGGEITSDTDTKDISTNKITGKSRPDVDLAI